MPDILLKLIEPLNSSVFVLLVILGASYWGVYVVSKLIAKFSTHEDKLTKMDALSERLIEVKTKVDLIYQNTNPHKLVAAQSPLSLTATGQEVADKIDAKRIFERYAGQLERIIEEAAPKNAYDVQVESMKIAQEKLIDLLDAHEINTIKEVAFSKGLLVQDVLGVFGVFLRDLILSKKGIPVADVDRNQPAT